MWQAIFFVGLLAVVLPGLKLFGALTWHWWVVLLPLWGFLAGIVLMAVYVAIIYTAKH